jgi:hypothetical protein
VSQPRGIMGSGGDWSSVRDGVPFFLNLGDGEGTLRRSSGSSKPPTASPWSPQAPPRLQLRRVVAEFSARPQRLGQRQRLGLGQKYA